MRFLFGSKKKTFILLFVEDDEETADFFRRIFKKSAPAWQLHYACNGMEAMQYIMEKGRPHLLITDLKMPHLTGLELIGWIRGNARLRDIPIAVLTSSNAARDREDCHSLGVKHYLHKPKALPDLSNILKTLIEPFRDRAAK